MELLKTKITQDDQIVVTKEMCAVLNRFGYMRVLELSINQKLYKLTHCSGNY